MELLTLSWLDIIIVFVFLYYAWEGYILGFFVATLDLFSFLLSFLVGLRLYSLVGFLVYQSFSIPRGFSHAIAFFAVAFIAEVIISLLFRRLLKVLTQSHLFFRRDYSESFLFVNKLFGIIPGILSAGVLLTFLLTVVITFPLAPSLKNIIFDSTIGSVLVSRAQGFEKRINPVFAGAIKETLNFLTVEPKSSEFINLHFTAKSGIVDERAEDQMLVLINQERKKLGLPELVMDENLRLIAQAYADDMLKRGYFSHYSPEGFSPFDRMKNAGIMYQAAGENLALAPNVHLAMDGLMQSLGHRTNILSRDFHKVGIGVIDGGIYGQMFTQEFTD